MQGLQHLGGGAHEGSGDHRGTLRKLLRNSGPVEQLLEGEGGDEPRAGPEVLGGRLPGAQRVPREADTRRGPLAELLLIEPPLERASAAGEVVGQRRAEAPQLGLVAGEFFSDSNIIRKLMAQCTLLNGEYGRYI